MRDFQQIVPAKTRARSVGKLSKHGRILNVTNGHCSVYFSLQNILNFANMQSLYVVEKANLEATAATVEAIDEKLSDVSFDFVSIISSIFTRYNLLVKSFYSGYRPFTR